MEVGIGVESANFMIRELCHHKGIEDNNNIVKTIKILNEYNCKALAYINFKPIFLTEKEAIEDAINTGVQCLEMGFHAISIEPTSIQEYALTDYLREIGHYRVPWLWSVREVIKGIYDRMGTGKKIDVRIGGYFDEEVLSGSQGASFDNRNEIFPIQNAFNCTACSSSLIQQIKQYNMTYDVKDLYKINKCPHCTEMWKAVVEIVDSRRLITRIVDLLG